ncbi:MAG TPA: Ppx/GppA phosphatase family protein [Actinomycetota bacterium]
MRLAAFDVGTNSTRLLVADVDDGRISEQFDREMIITRLGKGVDANRRFDPGALRRTLEVLGEYAATCDRFGVGPQRRRLVATSATRDVANREEFLDGVRRLVGVEAEVLTGEQEAAASYLGATGDLDGDARTLVVDIGGGSTEFIVGNRDPEAAISLEIGCVRLFERHLHSDPPTADQVAALRADVREHLERVQTVFDPSSATRVVGVAGTVTTVAALTLDLDHYDPERIHHAVLEAPRIAATARRLCRLTIAQRAALPVMAPGREDVIAAGALVLDEICRTFRFARVVASETDILDGVLLELARNRSPARDRSPGGPGAARAQGSDGSARTDRGGRG